MNKSIVIALIALMLVYPVPNYSASYESTNYDTTNYDMTSNQPIRVAVASNFSQTIAALVTAFEKQTGHDVTVSLGSSGKLFAQISHGAPYDLFLSADQEKPAELIKNGLAVANSKRTYALGRLVLLAKPDVTPAKEQLLSNTFNKLALANPRLAPYGAAAVAVLDKLNLVPTTRPNWVMGENIAQTYQFVSTGNADLGFVALSQVQLAQESLSKSDMSPQSKSKVNYWLVPENYHTPIKQDMIMLQRASRNSASQHFYDYLQSGQAQKIIQSFGYQAQ